jgi:hypothetical protein
MNNRIIFNKNLDWTLVIDWIVAYPAIYITPFSTMNRHFAH